MSRPFCCADGGGNLLFLDHPGECCPMLDQATFACRIYEQRPRVWVVSRQVV